jgi:hypothetical protein
MSLEDKFSALSLSDVPSVIETAKKDLKGVAAGIEALKARCESKEDSEAIAALSLVQKMMEEVPEAQAFVKECLGACT